MVSGGEGKKHEQSICKLRKALPFRKRLTGSGEFSGSRAEHARLLLTRRSPIRKKFADEAQRLPRLANRRYQYPCKPASRKEVPSAHPTPGAGSWLAKGSRPDPARQINLGRQTLPRPISGGARQANASARSARQFSEAAVSPSTPFKELRLALRLDTSQQNTAQFGIKRRRR